MNCWSPPTPAVSTSTVLLLSVTHTDTHTWLCSLLWYLVYRLEGGCEWASPAAAVHSEWFGDGKIQVRHCSANCLLLLLDSTSVCSAQYPFSRAGLSVLNINQSLFSFITLYLLYQKTKQTLIFAFHKATDSHPNTHHTHTEDVQ